MLRFGQNNQISQKEAARCICACQLEFHKTRELADLAEKVNIQPLRIFGMNSRQVASDSGICFRISQSCFARLWIGLLPQVSY
jgi:class 3 adenylate cyclase